MVIKKKSALVVDDDMAFCELVKTILEAKGMDVVVVYSITQAKEYLKTEVPNVILLDMELHNERGNDFLKDRAKDPTLSKIPVIVCSSNAVSTIVKEAIRYRADDYLLKPIKQTWLIQRVRKLLMREESMTYYFDENEEVDLEVEATPVSISKENFIARSSIGMEKGTVVTVSIPQADYSIMTNDFKCEEKSRYHSRGPFDTLFVSANLTENEKNRVQLLKSFWKF